MSRATTQKVELRVRKALLDDLKHRVRGTQITLDNYINALLMVQVVGMINSVREDEKRWQEWDKRQAVKVAATDKV